MPIWRWSVDTPPDRLGSLWSFQLAGPAGWAIFGAVLALGPGTWASPVLSVAFGLTVVEYAAWWRIGGHLGSLAPISLRNMARTIRLPEWIALVLVYGTFAWVGAAVFIRKHLGVAPVRSSNQGIETAGKLLLVLGLAAVCLYWALEKLFDQREWLGWGPRANRSRWLRRLPLNRWLFQFLLGFGTIGIYLVVYSRLT
jgi:hypothetical protein